MQESREVQDGIISVLEKGAENSTRILEQLLTAGEVRAPVLQSFSLTNKSTESQWSRNKLVPDEQFKFQIHYELGNYHFLQERFADALHHFTEATKLVPEISSNPEFCEVDQQKLQGFYSCCSAICGRTTPVAKRSLYDRFTHSIANNYAGLLEILIQDNLMCEIPFYLRQNLQLDLISKHDKIPEGLLFHVQTLNTVGNVVQGRLWDNSYPFSLLQAGKTGAQYLVQLLASKLSQYSTLHRQRVRVFVETLAMSDGLKEILVPQLMACAPLASLFSHEEIVSLLPASDDKKAKDTAKAFNVSLGADYNNINDIIWDLIHSYNIRVLEKAFECYLTAQLPRPTMVKKEILDINSKWKGLVPNPIGSTLIKILQEPRRGFVLMLIAKSQELSMAKSFDLSVEILNEASSIISKSTQDSSSAYKMISWVILVSKIQKQIHSLPCVDENEIRNLTVESKQCIQCRKNNRDPTVPWTSVVNWCILLLLNAQDWASFSGNLGLSASHYPMMLILKPLTTAANALNEKVNAKKAWTDLLDVVTDILKKRSSSNQTDRYRDVVMSRASFLELIESVKEPFCLSILVSLLGHMLNVLSLDRSNSLHIDHQNMWPVTVSEDLHKNCVQEILVFVVDHATALYPFASHPVLPMCSSWFLTKADLAFNKEDFHMAIKNYLTAIFMATDYLRNDSNNPEQNFMNKNVLKRMIKSCMNLNAFTQAAILSQFNENMDYNTAIGCLQERISIDAMDAYYDCLFDVTLMEFIINLHQKRGEIQRRDRVMKIIGCLELNSNNNEEIQREAAKVRKHRFLRAMAKQYL